MHNTFPPIPPSLPEALEFHFRPLIIEPASDLPSIQYNAGQQSVLRFLRQVMERQAEADRQTFYPSEV